ncbi:MAG: type I glyceraldehyde-3-phosphate dehydrogenase [Puniceicoccales bacterium]|jgi:glyceraldehyde 3-phosphate dehydrogenase|nr:type I glyceraldehyde-3-phosphate dehydrogenase [Puniceicoccales bacterium]
MAKRIRVGINGFGRIGRLVFRAMEEMNLREQGIEVVAVNDLVPADNLAYLVRYDSTQGRFPGTAEALDEETLRVNGHDIKCLAHRDGPASLPWRELAVDLVVESTGLFTQAGLADGHLTAGAKKVIISAPTKGDGVKTIVRGVNCASLRAEDNLISNASCTTNCLAPIAKVLLERFGIEEGLMTTIHSYTATQKTVDGPSRKDWKGGRTAACNIIPSTTGAAKAVGLVLPQLQGKLTGMSFRVPTPTVSVVDLTFRTEKQTSYREICKAMEEAAKEGSLKGILAHTADEVVSSDFIHCTYSSIFDAGSGIELNGRFFKVVAWYDNEWGYSCRCAELVRQVAAFL